MTRGPTDGPLWRGEVDAAPTPAMRELLGVDDRRTFTTETSPRIPPECYPFLIFWWPLALLDAEPEQLTHRVPLHTIAVHEPGPVIVPTARAWTGSVCIELVYANGDTEWIGPAS